MTLNLLFSAPDLFRAGFAGAAVTDWRNYDTIYTERYMGSLRKTKTDTRERPHVRAARFNGRLMIATIWRTIMFSSRTPCNSPTPAGRGIQFEMQIYAAGAMA